MVSDFEGSTNSRHSGPGVKGIDGSDVRGVLFSAGSRPGPFSFLIDDVRFK